MAERVPDISRRNDAPISGDTIPDPDIRRDDALVANQARNGGLISYENPGYGETSEPKSD